MEEYLDELSSEIRRLIGRVDNYLDEVLPDTYTEISRYAERRSYNYFYKEIESYDVKVMLSSNFKKISSEFFDLLYDELNIGLRKIERNVDDNKNLTSLLESYNESIIDFSRDALKNIINRCMPNFIEEFRYEYKVNYENQGYVSWLENETFELLGETAQMITKFIDRQFEEIRENYKYNYKEKIEHEDELKPLDDKYLIAEDRLKDFYQKNKNYDTDYKVYDAIDKYMYYINEFKNKSGLTKREIQILDLTMITAELACQSINNNFSLANDNSVVNVMEDKINMTGLGIGINEPKTVLNPKSQSNNYSSNKSALKYFEEGIEKDFARMGFGLSEEASSFASRLR